MTILEQIKALLAQLEAPALPEIGPDDVYLQVTGNVFPKPKPSTTGNPMDGEMFVGYVMRVGRVTGRSTSSVGSLFLGSAHLFEGLPGGFTTDGKNWPVACDKYFNAAAYMTKEELAAQDASERSWQAWGEAMKHNQGPSDRAPHRNRPEKTERAKADPTGTLPPGETPL